ncbi:MAG: Na+/H+ antiporter NhaC family protein [Treponema sp.]|nr:Na+/H+ antiporter NhaC family protein [Spirochaetia bacterium]MDD7460324.1 Na+/H+ antiporter NhaC family protein [Spirochaetales bacterium]MDY5812554.1 Na+/H+ antiporter NhaC family protein [Treponema sp.]
MIGTFWSLIPPVVAITLALITKEVYSSLFIGILIGGLFYSGFSFTGTITHIFQDGVVKSLSDSYNVGILVFLVVLGTMVALMNKAGGSAAFGKWAKEHIKTKIGAQVATVVLGILIFIDDYFNCLTVGSVMRPITDRYGVRREKLAYLIDSTAAPICIIAPVSSWAAAVTGFVEGEDGFNLFLRAIPYNFYALFTIVAMFSLILSDLSFGPMKKFEDEKINYAEEEDKTIETKGTVFDLVFPIATLIILCVIGMIYSGGFFASGEDKKGFVEAFSASDASVGLMLGSIGALIVTIITYLIRRVLKFEKIMACLPEGFKAMVPAILILTLAWTLKGMTDSLGAKEFVAGIVQSGAGSFMSLLPALVFVIAIFLAFATGTSWGTFGILIPIVVAIFSNTDPELMIISISACMAGAVCGDHCSPISDTTIMSSAGAQCVHLDHVSTQIPYAMCVAGISFVTYIIAGFVKNPFVPFIIGTAAIIGGVIFLKKRQAVAK